MSNQFQEPLLPKQPREYESIMAELDRWVLAHGNGKYCPNDYEPLHPLALCPNYGIQQVRDEISGFAKKILSRNLSNCILEIGLGYYGSTHILWRQLFQKVITLEKSPERCRDFAINFSKFYNGLWPTDNNRSGFIFGSSSDPLVVQKTYDAVGRSADALFIDGDHSYRAVLCDWLLYHNLVRKGGIIAFHDCATPAKEQSGAPKLIQQLENGEIDGKKYSFCRIIHSKHIGIAFYENE